jgi:hypothetical protein
MNLKKIIYSKKAYIGAIGDDLPSIIPIFLGLIIFFAVFMNTYNVYRNSNNLYSLQNETIKIANTMTSEPLISDINTFKKMCDKVNTKYNWNSFIVDLDLNSENYRSLNKFDLCDENLFFEYINNNNNNDKEYFKCFELDDFKNNTNDKETIVYMFPTTIQKTDFVYPARIYVVAWQ